MLIRFDKRNTLHNGKKNGIQKNWYSSGKKKFIKHFKDGIENGIRKEWDKVRKHFKETSLMVLRNNK
ncbi:MAG: hypothetical protein HOK65_05765 [Crocinitomicaceae bacterium]|jgi:antitoxin component YwqK of YwqJK toxin-antitoxin module|nr:hypothetical protein [Crocinitomicaceae bacterium]